MSDPFEYFMPRQVTATIWVGAPGGETSQIQIDAWCIGDLGAFCETRGPLVHSHPWRIMHVPSGAGLGMVNGCFAERSQIAAAIEELSKLRNSWDITNADEVQQVKMFTEVSEVCKNHGGVSFPVQFPFREPQNIEKVNPSVEEL